MAANKKQVPRAVHGGERHIQVVASRDAEEGAYEKHLHGVQSMHPVLVNLQTKNISSGTSIKHELKKIAAQKNSIGPYDKRSKSSKGIIVPTVLPESAEQVYGAPELHSTLRIGQALVKAKNKRPDLAELVENKLQSPSTGPRVKKQASKGVTVPVSQKIFSDLVSVDVSEEELAKQLEEQLHMRAAAVRPPARSQDSEPQLVDYFNPEEYVTRAKVTTAKVYLPFSSVKPQTVRREEYLMLCNHLLGSTYR